MSRYLGFLDKTAEILLYAKLGPPVFDIVQSAANANILHVALSATDLFQAYCDLKEATGKIVLDSTVPNKTSFKQRINESYEMCDAILSQRAWWAALMDDARDEPSLTIKEVQRSPTGTSQISSRQRLLVMFWAQTTQEQRYCLDKLIDAASDLKANRFAETSPHNNGPPTASVVKPAATLKFDYSSLLSTHATGTAALRLLAAAPFSFPRTPVDLPLIDVNTDVVKILTHLNAPKVVISPQLLSAVPRSSSLTDLPSTKESLVKIAVKALTTGPVDNLLATALREMDQDEKEKIVQKIKDEYPLMQIVMQLELTVESWHKTIHKVGEMLSLVEPSPRNVIADISTAEMLTDLVTPSPKDDIAEFLCDHPQVDKQFKSLHVYWNSPEVRSLTTPLFPLLLKSGSSDNRLLAAKERGSYILKFIEGAQNYVKAVMNSLGT
jgi:hypothetical protein